MARIKTDLAHRLLRAISTDSFVGEDSLRATLDIDQAALERALKELADASFELESSEGSGLRISKNYTPIDPKGLAWRLEGNQYGRVLECFATLESTSDYLRSRFSEPDPFETGTIVLAEHQTAGRGRFGRRWLSSPGASICFSIYDRVSKPLSRWSALGLVVAVGVTDALAQLGADGVAIKWPNDVVWGDRKIAGILVEVAPAGNETLHVCIGIGLNFCLRAGMQENVSQPIADLATVLDPSILRTEITAEVLGFVSKAVHEFKQQEVGGILERWRARDALYGREVRIEWDSGAALGVAKGIDGSGALIVEVDGRVKKFTSGEVSVRVTGDTISPIPL